MSFSERLLRLNHATKIKSVLSLNPADKRALQVMKTCVQRRRRRQEVLAALDSLLSVRQNKERRDCGAQLLAEYVASQSGLVVRKASTSSKQTLCGPCVVEVAPSNATSSGQITCA